MSRILVCLGAMLTLAALSIANAQPTTVYYGGAIMRGSYRQSTAIGAVTITQTVTGTIIVNATIYNIPPGLYGFHIHSYGDLTSDIGSNDIVSTAAGVGTHFNPGETGKHGCPLLNTSYQLHVGDLGNIRITSNPTNAIFTPSLVSLSGSSMNSVIGRAIVMHSMKDDCTGANGNAMTPWMSGVIGIINPNSNSWIYNVPKPAINAAAAIFLTASDPPIQSLVAVMFPRGGAGIVQQAAGVVRFTPAESSLTTVAVRLTNLTAGSVHGFHIHTYGDDFDASIAPFNAVAWDNVGAHFDPFNTSHHAWPFQTPRHSGDTGNITADSDGTITTVFTVDLLDLGVDVNQSIIGRAVAVHVNADDGQTQPTGNAGYRIFVGVIGVSAQNVTANLATTFAPFPVDPFSLPLNDNNNNNNNNNIESTLVSSLVSACG